jgi:hypothetical protein
MSKVALMRRTLAMTNDSYESTWREYKMTNEEEFNAKKEKALEVASELDDRLFLSSKTYTLTELLKVIDHAILEDYDGLFVDYFQLVEYDLKDSTFTEAEKLKKITTKVKERVKDSKLMFCWLSQVVEDKKDVRNDYSKGTSQMKNDVAGIINVFTEEENDNALKIFVRKDRHNGNEGVEVEVAFNRGKQRIGEFAKGQLKNQSIDRAKFIDGVQQIKIKQEHISVEDTQDDLPF